MKIIILNAVVRRSVLFFFVLSAAFVGGGLWLNQNADQLQQSTQQVLEHDHSSMVHHAHADSHHGALPHNIPDFVNEPGKSTIRSSKSGTWSSGSTWQGGVVPTQNHIVVVDSGHTVTISDTNALAHTLSIDGKVAFATNTNTALKVNNLMVMHGGELQVGTSSSPIAANVTAEIIIADKALNTTFDPEQYGNGVLGFGKVITHGAIKDPTYVKLAVEPLKGHTSLVLSEAVNGWRVGDIIRLPNSNQVNKVRGMGVQEFSITSISGDRKTIGLSKALAYDAPGARDADGKPTVINGRTLMPYVMNTTRNIVIRSENPSTNRGHVLMTHRAEVSLKYTEFKDLGRTSMSSLRSTTFDKNGQVATIGTNQIGRYMLHLHHLYGPVNPSNTGYQYEIVGNSLHDGRKWGLAIHGTHYGLVRGNVMYKVQGSGLFTEDGSESFNVIEKNFIANITGGDGNDFKDGRAADPFWFHGPSNYVRDNVAANGTWGYSIFMQDLDGPSTKYSRVPKFRGADTMDNSQVDIFEMRKMPIVEFARNEAYTVTDGGINLWALGEANSRSIPRSVMKDTYIWHPEMDAFLGYIMHGLTVDGLYVRGDNRHLSTDYRAMKYLIPRGSGFTNLRAGYETKIANFDIQGMTRGITVPRETNEARDGYGAMIIENGYLRNHINVYFNTHSEAKDYSDRQIYVKNVRHSSLPNTRAADSPHYDIYAVYSKGEAERADAFYFLSHNGNSSDNFRVYWPEQAATTIGGIKAPCTGTRTDVRGIVCGISAMALPTFGGGPTPTPVPTPNPTPTPTPTAGVSLPTIVSFFADPAQVEKGSQTQLTWTVSGATSVNISNIGSVTLSGTRVVTLDQTTEYELTATNSAGSRKSSVTVSVREPQPTAELTVSDDEITKGESVTLTWKTTNAESVVIDPDIGKVSANGSKTVTPNGNIEYTVTASNSDDFSVFDSVVITVTGGGPAQPWPTEVPGGGGGGAIPPEPPSSSPTNPGGGGGGATPPGTPSNPSSPRPVKDGQLVLDRGTVYIISDGAKRPFTSMEVFKGLGYKEQNIVPVDTTSIPDGPAIATTSTRHPRGSLVNQAGTIYFVGAEIRYPFPSAEVFLSWGVRFEDVVPATSEDAAMPVGPVVEPMGADSTQRHPRATLVNISGTIYFLGSEVRYPFPSAEVFLSWGVRFEDVVPASAGDITMPVGPVVELKQ